MIVLFPGHTNMLFPGHTHMLFPGHTHMLFPFLLRPNENKCVLGMKMLGGVGTHIFYLFFFL